MHNATYYLIATLTSDSLFMATLPNHILLNTELGYARKSRCIKSSVVGWLLNYRVHVDFMKPWLLLNYVLIEL